ncbi:hypothetical protein LTSEBAI_1018, partial [Salmonella enterica subsp. enterica serovar Baildon str. R6-199]
MNHPLNCRNSALPFSKRTPSQPPHTESSSAPQNG